MYKISIIGVHNPILFITPLCLENPPLLSLYFLSTYLESLLCVMVRSRPLRSLVGCKLTFPPPPIFSPFPLSLSSTVPHFKYMPSYDDITISASHSPIQYPTTQIKIKFLNYLCLKKRFCTPLWKTLWCMRVGGVPVGNWNTFYKKTLSCMFTLSLLFL